ncbi:MAG: pseudouridine synthase, partial [Burkholderiales bacterium]|nr:pseudouridine synthase [Burkholderiales bacterium]
MAERPTIKLKPGAAPRNPQRLRVRATTAPRTQKDKDAASADAARPPAAPRHKPRPPEAERR